MGKLDGKVAIVTGAGRGIGRGIALAFAKEGAAVVIAEWDGPAADAVTQELGQLGAQAFAVACDVGSEAQVKQMVEQAVERLGRIDILVNNAQAWGPSANRDPAIPLIPLEDLAVDTWNHTFQTGVTATFYCCKAVFPYMKERGGKIINFGSWWGMTGVAGAAAYNANKEAIRALTRTAAREWGKYRINVNVVCPTAETSALAAWAQAHPQEYQERLQTIPLRRYGRPEEDIGRVVVFLASEEADFITGSTVMADGGIFMCP